MKHVLKIAKLADIVSLSARLGASVSAGKILKLTVEPWQSKRSLEQNALYWATLTDISREAPAHMDGVFYAPDVWHEHFRRLFLPMRPGPGGEGIPTSTTSLSVTEMADYITQVQAWQADELS